MALFLLFGDNNSSSSHLIFHFSSIPFISFSHPTSSSTNQPPSSQSHHPFNPHSNNFFQIGKREDLPPLSFIFTLILCPLCLFCLMMLFSQIWHIERGILVREWILMMSDHQERRKRRRDGGMRQTHDNNNQSSSLLSSSSLMITNNDNMLTNNHHHSSIKEDEFYDIEEEGQNHNLVEDIQKQEQQDQEYIKSHFSPNSLSYWWVSWEMKKKNWKVWWEET